MHVAHFVHRYPPAVGGAEAYFARLGEYLAANGDAVTVWTTTAVELAEMWGRAGSGTGTVPREGGGVDPTPQPPPRSGEGGENPGAESVPSRVGSPPRFGEGPGVGLSLPPTGTRNPTPQPPPRNGAGEQIVRRYRPVGFPARRYVLKAASLVPVRPWQLLTLPCNPVCPQMWHDVGRFDGPLDAVHATAFPYAFPLMCGLRLARRRGVPFLLTPFLHLGDPTDPRDRTRRQYTTRPLRWLLRQADRVFVQTPSEAGAAIDCGVSPDRVVLQGLGVEPAECTGGDRESARRAWGVRDGEVVVGHLANLSVEKGSVDLLRAMGTVPGKLVLAGPAMPNFERAWAECPHRDRVVRTGVLSDAAKRDFFAGIDVFALPSRTDSFGLVLLEAWANAKPVVAYRAGGPADLVRDGTDGVLARCGDGSELTERLRRLAGDPVLRGKFGDAGRVRVLAEFRWPDKLRIVRNTMATASDLAGGRV